MKEAQEIARRERGSCQFILKTDERCQCYALKVDSFCWVHSERTEIIERRQAGRLKGGKNRRLKWEAETVFGINVKDIKSAQFLLKIVIQKLAMNQLSSHQAGTAIRAIRALIDSFKVEKELLAQMKELSDKKYLENLRTMMAKGK